MTSRIPLRILLIAVLSSSRLGAQAKIGVHVTGVAYDSIAGEAFGGASIQLVPTANPTSALSAAADANGRFSLEGVALGRYEVTFYHARLDSIGFVAPVFRVDLRSDTTLVLATPSTTTLARNLCPRKRDQTAGSEAAALLMGKVVNGTTGEPVAGAHVPIATELHTRLAPISVPYGTVFTNAAGRFIACGIPAESKVSVYAETPDRLSEMREATPQSAAFLYAMLSLVDSLGRSRNGSYLAQYAPTLVVGTTIRGVIRDTAGSPLVGASVSLIGDSVVAHSGNDGKFALRARPGHATLLIRASGFQRASEAVLVTTDDIDRDPLIVRLPPAVTRLDAAAVAAVETRSGFTARRKAGNGAFVDASEIEALHATELADVFHHVTSGRVSFSDKTDTVVTVPGVGGPCQPRVFVDGQLYPGNPSRFLTGAEIEMLVKPEEVAAMEVYRADETPAQFRVYHQGKWCGAIVIWRKP